MYKTKQFNAGDTHMYTPSLPPFLQPTRKEQAVYLLELLLRKDNRTYISFYNALVRESYGDLAGLLHNSLPLISPEAEKSFSDGGTPHGEWWGI